MAETAAFFSEVIANIVLFVDNYSSFRLTGKPAVSSPARQKGRPQLEELELAGDLYLSLSSLTWNLKAVALTSLYAVSTIGTLWLLICSSSLFMRLLAFWCLVELGWANFMAYRYYVVNQHTNEVPSAETIAKIEERMFSLKDCVDFKQLVAGWFGVDASELGRGNIADFLAFGFYNKPVDQVDPQLRERIEAWLQRAEQTWDLRCGCGRPRCDCRNPAIAFMAHLWDDLKVMHRPLVVQLTSHLAGMFTHAWLRRQGFKSFRHGAETYWVHPAEGQLLDVNLVPPAAPPNTRLSSMGARGDSAMRLFPSSKLHAESAEPSAESSDSYDNLGDIPSEDTRPTAGPRPIVFLHGVGFGLLPYLHFLKKLMRGNPGQPIIVTEVRHVSLRFCLQAAPIDATADLIAAVLRRHGFPDACIVGHSFGTFHASRLCQLYRPMVQSLVLMDPVCLMTCHPQLLGNFIYRGNPLLELLAQPGKLAADTWAALTGAVPMRQWKWSAAATLMDSLRFFVSREPVVAQSICRRFLWQELMLWPEDMPDAVVGCVSANDDLVAADPVVKQLQAAGKKVLFHPTAVHGTVLFDLAFQDKIVAQIQELVTHDQRSHPIKAE